MRRVEPSILPSSSNRLLDYPRVEEEQSEGVKLYFRST